MTLYASTDPCPECRTRLDQIPLKDCRTHRLHNMELRIEEIEEDEARWKDLTWRQRHEEDPDRAFADLAALVEEKIA